MSTTTCLPNLARSFLAAIALGGGGLVVGTILVFVTQFAVASTGVELTPFVLVVTSLTLLQGITFGGVTLAYTRYHDLDRLYFGVSMPSFRDLVAIVLGYVTILIAAFVDAFLVLTFGIQARSSQVTEIATQDSGVLLLLVPASLFLTGPGEELLLRGAVRDRIRESFGSVPGIALISAIFTVIHHAVLTGDTDGRLVAIGILFPPGAIFGVAYGLTGSITVPALICGAYNTTPFSFTYLVFKLTRMNPGGVPTRLLL